MRIIEALSRTKPCFSLEFSPPRTPVGWRSLWRTVGALRDFEPAFVSVTYGAGGSTRGETTRAVVDIKREFGIESMAHLTCVGHSRVELRQVLGTLREGGIENVIALRGDPPRGVERFEPAPDGLSHGSELASFIRDEGFDFCVAGAA
jgi:methylenetetrahydrofolate reductase (NADPH)